MLQKPSLEELEGLSKTHLFLMDIGIWILSDRAVEVLMKRSLKEGTNDISYYDLYSDYGLALGQILFQTRWSSLLPARAHSTRTTS